MSIVFEKKIYYLLSALVELELFAFGGGGGIFSLSVVIDVKLRGESMRGVFGALTAGGAAGSVTSSAGDSERTRFDARFSRSLTEELEFNFSFGSSFALRLSASTGGSTDVSDFFRFFDFSLSPRSMTKPASESSDGKSNAPGPEKKYFSKKKMKIGKFIAMLVYLRRNYSAIDETIENSAPVNTNCIFLEFVYRMTRTLAMRKGLFLTKICLAKILMFDLNFKFGPKFRILTQISNFHPSFKV